MKPSSLLYATKILSFLKMIFPRQQNFFYQTVSITDAIYNFFVLMGMWFGFSYDNKKEILVNTLRKYFKVNNIYLFGSARSALYTILKSLTLEKNAEVLVTGFTCEVVPNAVINAKLKPVYVDIDENTLCTSYESIKSKITDKTRVLIVQHSFGMPADLERIISLARDHKLFVIEDCAVSLLTKYRDKQTGTFGDAAIFSLELSKVITCGRGGICLINSNPLNERFKVAYDRLAEMPKTRVLRILFQTGLLAILMKPGIFFFSKYLVAFLYKTGILQQSTTDEEHNARLPKDYLFKLSNAQCAVLLRQMAKLEELKSHSRAVCAKLIKGLAAFNSIRIPAVDGIRNCALIRLPVLVEERGKWVELFRKNHVDVNGWFTAPLSSESIDHSLFGYTFGDCPVAEGVAKKIINLPLHINVNSSDIKVILNTFEKQLNKVNKSRSKNETT